MVEKSGGALDKNDLYLLMEAYRNNFETATTLLTQQKHLTDQFVALIKEQEETRKSIDAVVENLDCCAKAMNTYITELKLGSTTLKNDIIGQVDKVDHKLSILWIGIGAILIPLIGLLISTVDKFKLIDQMYHLVMKTHGGG